MARQGVARASALVNDVNPKAVAAFDQELAEMTRRVDELCEGFRQHAQVYGNDAATSMIYKTAIHSFYSRHTSPEMMACIITAAIRKLVEKSA